MKPIALVIDNQNNNAKYLAKSLREIGCQVIQVTAGHQAQVQLTFTAPDLIFLNPALPMLPFNAILRQLRGQARFASTRLILLSDDSASSDFHHDAADLVLPPSIEHSKLQAALSLLMPTLIAK